MKHLIYTSLAVDPVTEEALLEILCSSQQNNALLAITGLLLYGEGRFIQYLEGSPDPLDALVSRIRADKRHKDFTVLSEGAIAERLFADWAMGFRSLANSGARRIPGYSGILEAPSPTLSAESISLPSSELLMLFRHLVSRA